VALRAEKGSTVTLCNSSRSERCVVVLGVAPEEGGAGSSGLLGGAGCAFQIDGPTELLLAPLQEAAVRLLFRPGRLGLCSELFVARTLDTGDGKGHGAGGDPSASGEAQEGERLALPLLGFGLEPPATAAEGAALAAGLAAAATVGDSGVDDEDEAKGNAGDDSAGAGTLLEVLDENERLRRAVAAQNAEMAARLGAAQGEVQRVGVRWRTAEQEAVAAGARLDSLRMELGRYAALGTVDEIREVTVRASALRFGRRSGKGSGGGSGSSSSSGLDCSSDEGIDKEDACKVRARARKSRRTAKRIPPPAKQRAAPPLAGKSPAVSPARKPRAKQSPGRSVAGAGYTTSSSSCGGGGSGGANSATRRRVAGKHRRAKASAATNGHRAKKADPSSSSKTAMLVFKSTGDNAYWLSARVGGTPRRRLRLCNFSHEALSVRITIDEGSAEPVFRCKHSAVEMEPRSCVYLPVRFCPTLPGRTTATITAVVPSGGANDGPAHACSMTLIGFAALEDELEGFQWKV